MQQITCSGGCGNTRTCRELDDGMGQGERAKTRAISVSPQP